MNNEVTFLDKVYGLDTPEKTRDLYRDWAASYDDELRANGYVSPARVAQAMADAVDDVTAPILDLGCGTGLSGEALAEAGFGTVDGTDFSAEMLAVAGRKAIYRQLIQGDLNDPLPAAADYANVAAIGVFSPGHAPAEMIDAVCALLPAGGCFGFTLNDHALEDPTYGDTISALESDGRMAVVFDEYGPHVPAQDLQAKVMVLRKAA